MRRLPQEIRAGFAQSPGCNACSDATGEQATNRRSGHQVKMVAKTLLAGALQLRFDVFKNDGGEQAAIATAGQAKDPAGVLPVVFRVPVGDAGHRSTYRSDSMNLSMPISRI